MPENSYLFNLKNEQGIEMNKENCHLEPVERSPEISPCAVIPRGSPCVVPTI
jgi:hypothetical protein